MIFPPTVTGSAPESFLTQSNQRAALASFKMAAVIGSEAQPGWPAAGALAGMLVGGVVGGGAEGRMEVIEVGLGEGDADGAGVMAMVEVITVVGRAGCEACTQAGKSTSKRSKIILSGVWNG